MALRESVQARIGDLALAAAGLTALTLERADDEESFGSKGTAVGCSRVVLLAPVVLLLLMTRRTEGGDERGDMSGESFGLTSGDNVGGDAADANGEAGVSVLSASELLPPLLEEAAFPLLLFSSARDLQMVSTSASQN